MSPTAHSDIISCSLRCPNGLSIRDARQLINWPSTPQSGLCLISLRGSIIICVRALVFVRAIRSMRCLWQLQAALAILHLQYSLHKSLPAAASNKCGVWRGQHVHLIAPAWSSLVPASASCHLPSGTRDTHKLCSLYLPRPGKPLEEVAGS